MKRLSKERFIEILLFLCACAMGMSLFVHAGFTRSNDDEVYRTAIQTWGSWKNWANAIYEGWSGRVILHSILIALTNMPIIIWKTISAVLVAVTSWMIYRIVTLNTVDTWKKLFLFGMIVTAWRMIPELYTPVIWASGSVNYLYPVTMLLICLYLFYSVLAGKQISNAMRFCGGIACVICGNMEQAAAVMLAVGALFFGYIGICWEKEKQVKNKVDLYYLFVLWIINAIVMYFSYTAPGNQIRSEMEMFRCVGYGMFSYIDKMLLGLQRFILGIATWKGFLIWMLPSGICALWAIENKCKKRLAASCAYIVLSVIHNIVVRKVINIEFLYPFDMAYIIWLVFTLILLFYNGYLILQCMNSKEDRFLFLFIYYGAIASNVVTGFSPTVFVSGGRTMYVSYVLLIMVAAKCMSECLKQKCRIRSKRRIRLEMLNMGLLGLSIFVLVGGFIFESYRVKHIDIRNMSNDQALLGHEMQIDSIERTIEAYVDVERFEYDVDNWCVEIDREADIRIEIGILNQKTQEADLYKTYLRPQWAVAEDFPDNRIRVVAHLWRGIELSTDETYVMIATDHTGNTVYNTFMDE